MLWFLKYFISKFKIRQIGGSRKPSVNELISTNRYCNINLV